MNKEVQKMMKQAQKMAADMQKAQEALASVEVEGTAGGGAVRVKATGDGAIISVTIDPDVFEGPPSEDDIEMLNDLVTVAVNDALDNARSAQEQAMGPLAGGVGGLGLPGM